MSPVVCQQENEKDNDSTHGSVDSNILHRQIRAAAALRLRECRLSGARGKSGLGSTLPRSGGTAISAISNPGIQRPLRTLSIRRNLITSRPECL